MPIQKHRIKKNFHTAAPRYDAHALLQREVAQRLFASSKDIFPKRSAILDAGCGTGYFHELARSNGYNWAITQYDLAYGMCELAASYGSPPAYGGTFTVNGDIEALSFADDSFTGIFSSLALQWVEGLEVAFREYYRVIKPGGNVCFSTFLPGTLRELADAFTAVDDLPHINDFVSEAALVAALKEAGFRDITCVPEHKTTLYPDVMALMQNLKHIGAAYKNPRAAYHYTRRDFAVLEETYRQHYSEGKGIYASWEIGYVMARK